MTRHRFYLAFTLVIGALCATACFDPHYPEGIGCGNDGVCPPGMECGGDNRCWLPGRECSVDSECASGICVAATGMCAAAACDDTMQNGAETDIDCGGGCPACGDGLGCGAPGDCQSQVCQSGTCAAPRCGDGVINQASEICDDGGPSATCNAGCMPASCGDGVVDAGEDCDDGGETATCDADCTAPSCGDAYANTAAGEACDDGGESAICNIDCTISACGDGLHNGSAGEQCDVGGESATCDIDCTVSVCGDGLQNGSAGEQCDDGGESVACDVDCTFSACGDGIVNSTAGEQCDDAGQSAVCDIDCTAVVCGDGVVNGTAGETCDDGNVVSGDGCNAACVSESGCSTLATWSHEMAPDLWLCAYNNVTGKSWPQTYGVCNEAGGYYLASVAPMTRRGLPGNAEIAAALNAAAANNHDYITTGHPARSCSWDSTLTSYESCNGLGYVHVSETTGAGSNWRALTDGNDTDYRAWPSANTTGAHRLASLCMNAASDPAAYIFDHRWR